MTDQEHGTATDPDVETTEDAPDDTSADAVNPEYERDDVGGA